jgi:large subunit ribosomal protein L29
VGEPRVPPRPNHGFPHVMKARELRDMTDGELEAALHDRRQELFNLRFQSATGALENSARLKLTKREIARILTVTTERAARAEKR